MCVRRLEDAKWREGREWRGEESERRAVLSW